MADFPSPALTNREGMSVLADAEADGPSREDTYYGNSSGISFLRQVQSALDQDVNASVYQLGDREFPDFETASFVLPPENVAKELVDRYFTFNSPTYRFLHRPEVDEALRHLYRDPTSLDDSRAAILFLLMAFGADCASRKMHYGFANSVRYYQAADRRLSRSKLNLRTVQASTLKCLYVLSASKSNTAWRTFGIVVREAQTLGLHRRSNSPECLEKELKRRLWGSIYTLDRYLAVLFGRPCAIHDEDVDQEMPSANDIYGSEAGSGAKEALAAPLHHAKLASILGKAIRLLYGPGQAEVQAAQNLFAELCTWHAELPVFLDSAKVDTSMLEDLYKRQVSYS